MNKKCIFIPGFARVPFGKLQSRNGAAGALTCSRLIERGRYEDAEASSTVPRGLYVLAVRLFTTCSLLISFAYLTCSLPTKLRLAYILCYFIRNRRCSLIFLSGFTRREYHIVRVDFIVALRRTKGRGRRTLRSPPSPSSGLHLIHPGNPLRRGISAAAVDRDISIW